MIRPKAALKRVPNNSLLFIKSRLGNTRLVLSLGVTPEEDEVTLGVSDLGRLITSARVPVVRILRHYFMTSPVEHEGSPRSGAARR